MRTIGIRSPRQTFPLRSLVSGRTLYCLVQVHVISTTLTVRPPPAPITGHPLPAQHHRMILEGCGFHIMSLTVRYNWISKPSMCGLWSSNANRLLFEDIEMEKKKETPQKGEATGETDVVSQIRVESALVTFSLCANSMQQLCHICHHVNVSASMGRGNFPMLGSALLPRVGRCGARGPPAVRPPYITWTTDFSFNIHKLINSNSTDGRDAISSDTRS